MRCDPPPARRAALAALAALAACGDGAPASPTYFADVQPILLANCARCHGADPSDPRVARFRLDRYVRDDAATFDVWDYAQASGAERAPLVRVAVDHEAPAMPPDYALTDRQRDVLARWVEQGAPKGTRDNRPPQIALLAPLDATAADQSLDVTIRAWDDDRDGLVVELWAHDLSRPDAEDVPLGPRAGGGTRSFTLDTGALASQRTFEIYAILDDGFADDPAQNRTRATLIPALAVDHGARGTAPTVRLLAPNGGEALIGTAAIAWTATDPDTGDSLAIDLALLAVAPDGTETVAAPIASGLPNTGTYAWTIPGDLPVTGPGGAPLSFRVRVTATDALGMPRNVRSDASDAPVTIARAAPTTLGWDDVKPLFVAYCVECHGQPARTMSLEAFRLDKYDAADPVPPVNADPGVFETRGAVYQRTIVAKNMPPASRPQPTAAELDRIASWLLGGAPRGGGPADARPTFAWTQPSATQTGSPVTLAWSAADAEGLASGRLEYAKVNGAPSTGCAGVAANAAWTPIPDPAASATLGGAAAWTGSFAWTPPAAASGYYCVRGSVVDTASQVTTVVNPFGIK